MAVKAKPKTYVAHGKEFTDADEAERYDKLHTAREEYEASREVFEKRLAESQTTADGKPFRFGGYQDYYFICNVFSFPDLRRVSFYGWNFQMQEDEAGISIREDGKESRWFRLKELYVDEFKARKALAVEQEKCIRRLVDDANAIRGVASMPPLDIVTEKTASA